MGRKAFEVPFHVAHEDPCLDAIEESEITIKHDLLTAGSHDFLPEA